MRGPAVPTPNLCGARSVRVRTGTRRSGVKVRILHDQRHEFRVVAIDLIPECRDEEVILEAFNGVPAAVWDGSPNLQLCLSNKTTDPCTTQKSARNTAAKNAGNCERRIHDQRDDQLH